MNLRDFIVVLDEKGKNFSSVEFSKFLRNQKDVGQNITFVIGGPYGLSNGVKSHANLIFSMSKLTFTHQMVRIILLEQIYRGFCIMAGKEYHNG
jgi:23S rRNA (pseudouridine1915-N3)-methyltransferase